jgi:hypothetical protein
MNPFIRVPDHWTPGQVELILDFIDDLYQAIWDQYGDEICLHWNAQHAEEQRKSGCADTKQR